MLGADDKNFSSLKEVYQRHFSIGAAVNVHTIKSQRDLLAAQFNRITAENEMKFAKVHPEEGVYTFDNADQLAEFAKENGMKMRGHTLGWHNQTPDWVFQDRNGVSADRAVLLNRMKEHIHTVVNRYKEQVYCWDVVNEAVTDEGPDLLRSTKWLDGIGADYVRKAFEYAHEADPRALLFYNDYNESNPEKREKIYALLKSLLKQGAPVHGVGMQAHWNISSPPVEHIRAAIERCASLGLQIHITEMDVSVFEFDDRRTDLLKPTEQMMELQEQRYDEFFKLFREYKDVISNITFWGVADDYTWLNDFPVKGRKNWPFVFDEQHQPKPSFWRIARF